MYRRRCRCWRGSGRRRGSGRWRGRRSAFGVRQDHAVVFRRARRRKQITRRRKHDLIDRKTVFTGLNAKGLIAGALEVDYRSEHAYAPTIVLPAPALHATAGTLFQVHFHRTARADAISRGTSRRSHAAGKLHEDGVVAPVIGFGATANPQAVSRSGYRVETDVEVIRRIHQRAGYFSCAGVRMAKCNLSRRARVRLANPRTAQRSCRYVCSPDHNVGS